VERMGFPESAYGAQRGTFLICWGIQGKSVPRQERNGSERAKIASVDEGKAHPRRTDLVAVSRKQVKTGPPRSYNQTLVR
jgi:hypothetical protein